MTFCLAMKVREGLVAISDSRITSGGETSTASKVSVDVNDRHAMFAMTSGLRSARDKALTYFEEAMEQTHATFDKLYKAVNAFAVQVRLVEAEDRDALAGANLHFNLHALMGGQFDNDREPKLYLLYPQANWVEVSRDTPYFVIGETGYAKPLLDRSLDYDTPLELALKIGYLAFEATRSSTTATDFPMDVVIYRRDSFRIHQRRFQAAELAAASAWWTNNLRSLIEAMPGEWLEGAFGTAPGNVTRLLKPPAAEEA
ncbi:MAG: proteasome-type protease [Actinomycetota bacterium]